MEYVVVDEMHNLTADWNKEKVNTFIGQVELHDCLFGTIQVKHTKTESMTFHVKKYLDSSNLSIPLLLCSKISKISLIKLYMTQFL